MENSIRKYEDIGVALSQFFIFVFLVFIFLNRAFSIPINRQIYVINVMLIFFCVFPYVYRKKPLFPIILFFLTIFYVVYWGNTHGKLWYMNRNLYNSLVAMVIGFLLVNSRLSRRTVFYPLVIIAIIIFSSALVLGENVSDSHFFEMNRNVIAYFVVTYAMLTIIWDGVQLHKVPSFIPPTISLVASAYSQSRAGILISVLLILFIIGNVGVHIFRKKDSRSNTAPNMNKTLFVIICSSLLIISIYIIINSRFLQQGFESSGRLAIYSGFFEELTFTKFLIGFRPSILEKTINLHNSFLDMIASSGISALIMFGLGFFGWYRLVKKSYFLSLVLLALVVYAQVEHVIFLRMGDFALYPLLMYAYEDFSFPKLKRKAPTS